MFHRWQGINLFPFRCVGLFILSGKSLTLFAESVCSSCRGICVLALWLNVLAPVKCKPFVKDLSKICWHLLVACITDITKCKRRDGAISFNNASLLLCASLTDKNRLLQRNSALLPLRRWFRLNQSSPETVIQCFGLPTCSTTKTFPMYHLLFGLILHYKLRLSLLLCI